jgi:glycosyltransferase involved in cell wall biosynthesis
MLQRGGAQKVPSVLYVKPSLTNRGKVALTWPDPLEKAFQETCNTLTVTVSHGFISSIRGKFISWLGRGLPSDTRGGAASASIPLNLLKRLSNFAGRLERIDLFALVKNTGFSPDLVFVNDIDVAIRDISKFGVPTCFWVNDPHISIDRYFDLQRVQDYDYVFVSQKSFVDTFRKRGCKNVSWLPVAVDPAYFKGERNEVYDISFVGKAYPGHRRYEVLRLVKENFGNVYVGRERQYDMGKIYLSSKIVVNRSLRRDLNVRVFEAMAAGAMLITNRDADGLNELFQENIHLVCYESNDELISKIRYYLEHDEERREIARKGHEEVMAKHTYQVRTREILRRVGLKTPEAG